MIKKSKIYTVSIKKTSNAGVIKQTFQILAIDEENAKEIAIALSDLKNSTTIEVQCNYGYIYYSTDLSLRG